MPLLIIKAKYVAYCSWRVRGLIFSLEAEKLLAKHFSLRLCSYGLIVNQPVADIGHIPAKRVASSVGRRLQNAFSVFHSTLSLASCCIALQEKKKKKVTCS